MKLWECFQPGFEWHCTSQRLHSRTGLHRRSSAWSSCCSWNSLHASSPRNQSINNQCFNSINPFHSSINPFIHQSIHSTIQSSNSSNDPINSSCNNSINSGKNSVNQFMQRFIPFIQANHNINSVIKRTCALFGTHRYQEFKCDAECRFKVCNVPWFYEVQVRSDSLRIDYQPVIVNHKILIIIQT